MEGNYRPTHNANNTNYSSAPTDMDGANTAPFTVSYDQTGVNSPQAPQQSYSQVGNFAYNPGYAPASFSPAPVGPQLSYATSDVGYGSGSNVNMGSRVADAVRNIDTDRIAGNIESGISYVTDKAGKFTTVAKDKLANPNRRKALAIMGGAVASLALAMSLGNAVLNKTNSSSYNQTPPTATSNNSSAESDQAAEIKDTDPNMNVETADSEHDGKISYKVYEFNEPKASANNTRDKYFLVGERTSQVDYSSSDTVNDRKEISMDDFVKRIAERNKNNINLSSINDVFAKEEDYHGPNAIVDLLEKYGGYKNISRLERTNSINDNFSGIVIRNAFHYNYSELASSNPNITNGCIQISIVNPNRDSNEYGYGNSFTIEIISLFGKDHGHIFRSGRIVCDYIPTEKELVQILKDNYDTIFKVDNDYVYGAGSTNKGAMESIARERRKP